MLRPVAVEELRDAERGGTNKIDAGHDGGGMRCRGHAINDQNSGKPHEEAGEGRSGAGHGFISAPLGGY